METSPVRSTPPVIPDPTDAELDAAASLSAETDLAADPWCSSDEPASEPAVVAELVAKHAGKKDWCGSQGSEWVPEGIGDVDWSDACKTHDECYGTPDASKYLCDYNLQQDIALACEAQGGSWLCYLASELYFHGVRTSQGDEAFERAQQNARGK